MGNIDACLSSRKPDWETPDWVLERIGPIELDPCSKLSNPTQANALCISPAEYDASGTAHPDEILRDGLEQDWGLSSGGLMVYVNPPYGRGVDKWLSKGFVEAEEAIYLLPARTDVKWFHRLPANVTKCFLRGRLTFNGAVNKKTGKPQPAPFPSLLLYHGPRRHWFRETWSDKGMILS